jgi:hypothetical protein
MESLEQYFDRCDTPAANSPVGALMARVIVKNLGMGYDEARTEAKRLLNLAAGKRIFRTPQVFSPAERAARSEKFRTVFGSKAA